MSWVFLPFVINQTMSLIREILIQNYRGIKSLKWHPSEGLNCLVGPGDSGKSTILDAIDLCLGARRNSQFTDADFHRLNVDEPLEISITIGNLEPELRNLEVYGDFLRGFDLESKEILDEPDGKAETVLTVRLLVESDLEPEWSLFSIRAEGQGEFRPLRWQEKTRLAPSRIGTGANYHLSWKVGSILNRLSGEQGDASAALLEAARSARKSFGDEDQEGFKDVLKTVSDTASELGISTGDNLKALLDVQAASFGNGAVSLHDENGVPLRGLGMGSTRLLVAGLQKQVLANSSVVLIDELEYGLEPQRIIRFLGALGAKEKKPPLQVFMTTHSPVVLRELEKKQLNLLRKDDSHEVFRCADAKNIQGTLRAYPEAFLATSVYVCEGASEVGLIRGLDQYRVGKGKESIFAHGASLVDAGGVTNIYKRTKAFEKLGFRVAVLRDDDKQPDKNEEGRFLFMVGQVFKWGEGNAIEDEIFWAVDDDSIHELLELAMEFLGRDLIDAQISTASEGKLCLDRVAKEHREEGKFSKVTRAVLGEASRSKENSWFKSVSKMERVAKEILGPRLSSAEPDFQSVVKDLIQWGIDGGS